MIYPSRIAVCATVALAIISGHCRAADVAITIDPTTTYAVNGVSQIQPIRSMVVNGDNLGQRVDLAAALNMTGTRLYLWADYGAADEPKGLSNYNLGLPDRVGWLLGHDMDAFERAEFDRQLDIDPATGKTAVPWQNRTGSSQQFLQLDYLRQWGATKNVVLHIVQPHPRSKADFEQYARYFRAVLREVKTRFPELGVRYVMLYNEPNISYLNRIDESNRAERIEFFYDLYRYVAASIREEFPGVSLIGPSLSQFYTWKDWDEWTVPFLTQVPDAPYFGAQVDAARFDELLAWNDMLQAKSLALNGHRVPMVLTEWNPQSIDAGALPGGCDYWQDKNEVSRVDLLAANLFGMMEHPDQFAFTSFFFYDCSHNGYDLLQVHNGTLTPTAGYWFYWTLRNLRGERIYAGADTAQDAIKTIAAVDGHWLNVALHNFGASPATIRLSLLRIPIGKLTDVKCDRLAYDSTSEAFTHETRFLGAWPTLVTLAEGETQVLSAQILTTERHSIDETERYSRDTAVTVQDAQRTLMVPAMNISKTDQVYVRAGINCDAIDAVNRITFTLNGHPIRVPFLPDDREKRTRSALQVNVPVPSSWLARPNVLVFSPGAKSYRVMSAALAVCPRPRFAPPLKSIPVVAEASSALDLSASLPREVYAGDALIHITVTNRSAKPQACSIAAHMPHGWMVRGGDVPLTCPPLGRIGHDYNVSIPEEALRAERIVTFVLKGADTEDQTLRLSTIYQPTLCATRAEVPPSLDGTLAGWNAAPFVEEHAPLTGGTPYKTATWLEWDDSRLYVAVRVTGRNLLSVPSGAQPWGRDVLEVFSDLANAKAARRDQSSLQTVIVLDREGPSKPEWYDAPTNASGEQIARTMSSTYCISVNREPNGFIAQASLDWRSLARLDGKPNLQEGQQIGFDLILASESVLGGGQAGSYWATPSKWGTLTLAGIQPQMRGCSSKL